MGERKYGERKRKIVMGGREMGESVSEREWKRASERKRQGERERKRERESWPSKCISHTASNASTPFTYVRVCVVCVCVCVCVIIHWGDYM